jgi:hypothetical protein
MEHEELREALKRGREGSDERVVTSLYHQALAGNVTACIFWLKNRRPSEWRDVQHLEQAVGHYIISDRPMSEEEWIEQRTKVIDAKPDATRVSTESSETTSETTGRADTGADPEWR